MGNNTTSEEQLRQHPGTFVEQIVKDLVSKKAVDVHFEDEDDTAWAEVKTHDYEADTEMGLRLLTEGRWVLQFGYYDDDDEFIELLQPLTPAEIGLIPNGLQKGMLKVLASEKGLRLPGDFLSR